LKAVAGYLPATRSAAACEALRARSLAFPVVEVVATDEGFASTVFGAAG
jgi:hypothetical protein